MLENSAGFGIFLLYNLAQNWYVGMSFELLAHFLHFPMCYNKLGNYSEKIGTCTYISILFSQYQSIRDQAIISYIFAKNMR